MSALLTTLALVACGLSASPQQEEHPEEGSTQEEAEEQPANERLPGEPPLFAEPPESPEEEEEEEEEEHEALLSWTGSVDWRLAHTVLQLADTVTNPGNENFEFAQHSSLSSLRARIEGEFGSQWEFLLRPRLALRVDKSQVNSVWLTEETTTRFEFIEAYAQWHVTDFLAVSYGLRHFWWGPGESLNPSNQLLRDSRIARTPTTFFRGRWLAYVGLSPWRNVTADFMLETRENENISEFIADEEFETRFLAKAQYGTSDDDGEGTYVGVVAGRGDTARPWVGEYGSLSLNDDFSLYLDMVHRRGSIAWYPVEDDGELGFEQTRIDSNQLRTFGVTGVRYNKNDVDLRLEYIFNQAGYTAEELQQAIRIVEESGSDDDVLDRYRDPGLEVTGRSYLFLAARVRDLGPGEAFTLRPRYFLSLSDFSGAAIFDLEWDVTDAWQLSFFLTLNHGADDLDLTRRERVRFQFESKYSW
ncbi:hypothetical protein ATI61_103515 [Archangium gephyra]|uniref:Uncharacterized protein n=1 Tax=Archangium gephyra TaxID=48 RepID=A0AAC8TDB9_9BACT|nr:hypothetical protein [Archangium gephyra]AKJ01800.1 Hypothetical protein AA314_03426 [Archangium gephyra]REG34609.1 hypothetical protein ATI61_103515 [Archangium gephyra]